MGLIDMFRRRPAPTTQLRFVQGPMVQLDIVGESFQTDNVQAVRDRHGMNEFSFHLEPEPHNTYDPHCVRVMVEDLHVGHLSREMAAAWQPMILAAQAEGFMVMGRARVLGGSESKPNLGVFGAAPWPGSGRPPDKWGR